MKTVEVRRGIASRITASRMNILTETGAPRFDLVIATNVFVYCSSGCSCGAASPSTFLPPEVIDACLCTAPRPEI